MKENYPALALVALILVLAVLTGRLNTNGAENLLPNQAPILPESFDCRKDPANLGDNGKVRLLGEVAYCWASEGKIHPNQEPANVKPPVYRSGEVDELPEVTGVLVREYEFQRNDPMSNDANSSYFLIVYDVQTYRTSVFVHLESFPIGIRLANGKEWRAVTKIPMGTKVVLHQKERAEYNVPQPFTDLWMRELIWADGGKSNFNFERIEVAR